MANNTDKSSPFHEIPSSDYWWLPGDIAVPIGFTKAWTLLTIILSSGSTAILCLTTWWQQLFTYITTYFYITHWYIGWPASIITAIVAYFILNKRHERKLAEKAEAARMRKYQNALINQNLNRGGEKKK
jgi:hypothetical protein